MTVLLKSS